MDLEPRDGRGGATAVLYVDDEPRSLKYFALAFGGDFPIRIASSVAEAETVLASDGSDIGVLVTDQRMPVETGVQLLVRVKQQYPQIVRLLTTAYADLDDAVSAINRGEIHRYILKPWDVPALRTELHAAIDLHRRKREERELLEARRRTVMSLASHIAHELSTPLATIRAASGNLDDHWQALVECYRDASYADGGQARIPESMLDLLEQTPGMILSMVDRANMLIRLLLMNTAEDAQDRSDYVRFSVSRCVLGALATYPFGEGERGRIRVEGPDFEVNGSEVLATYVLYNLLKNSLYAISSAHRGDILVRTLPGDVNNRLLFRDTGSGIPAQVLPYIFDEFYTGKSSGRGTGMGLPFCRRVMTAFGGAIRCRSVPGAFTEIELSFPRSDGAVGQNSPI